MFCAVENPLNQEHLTELVQQEHPRAHLGLPELKSQRLDLGTCILSSAPALCGSNAD